MIGYITGIFDEGYGFVQGDDQAYFFHANDLVEDDFADLRKGDELEFIPSENDRGPIAKEIRLYHEDKDEDVPYPGVNPQAELEHLSRDEQNVIQKLGRILYVTYVGQELRKGNSVYHYAYVKPTEYFRKTFRLNREIVVVFSDYDHFEPRALDVPGAIYERFDNMRLDRGCTILISRDHNVKERLGEYLKDSNASQIVVPFSYDEFLYSGNTDEMIRSRFRDYLFDANLFADSSAITDDVFFFGRRSYVQDITMKCRSGQHCGIFGLRRSGKTSLLYAVERALGKQDYPYAFIPCQSDLATLDWRSALRKVVQDVCQSLGRDDLYRKVSAEDYQEHTSERFEEDMNECLASQKYPVTIMFDEIEAITFGVNHGEDSDNLWMDGNNFVNFWNVIKGYYSKYPGSISVLIAGTNPAINEMPMAGNASNPMFQQLSQSNKGAFLPSFDQKDTEKMVNTLGGYMGIHFEDYAVAQMTNSCGGHPYLTKLLCSYIYQYVSKNHMERPLEITRPVYNAAVKGFEESPEARNFFTMILNILSTNYPKEYASLKHLALYDDNVVNALKDSDSLSHLIGYGLVECSQNHYDIRYDMIRDYLNGHYKYEREGLSVKEQRAEINERIGCAEDSLRLLIKQNLLSFHGKQEAREIVLDAFYQYSDEKTYEAALKLNYRQLFDPSKNRIYFTLLINIIRDHFDDFKNLPGFEDEGVVEDNLEELNYARRVPAHAFDENSENWSMEDFRKFRKAMTWLENALEDIA